MMSKEQHRLADLPAQEDVSFEKIKSLEAQVLLYRGFLHEVNNSLAGLGSLAEVLKDAEGDTLSKNMDLIIHAAYKSCDLQRKIRNLYTTHEESIDIDLSAFLQDHKPLIELIIRQQTRAAVVLGQPEIIHSRIDQLWNLFALGAIWANDKQAQKIEYSVANYKKLRVGLCNSIASPMDMAWETAFTNAGTAAEARCTTGADFVVFSF